MAIRTESMTINGRVFTRTWSDENRYVVRDGIEYSDAIDPSEFGRTYTEGDEMPYEPADELADKAEAFDILMGVDEP